MKVYDASAVLAMVFDEPGGAKVAGWMADGDGAITSVNLAEVLAKLHDHGMDAAAIGSVRSALPLTVEPFGDRDADLAAALRAATRKLGLSLGDRCCLAVAQRTGAEVVTADRSWKAIKGLRVTLIR